jgi:hypothetical protein
VTWSIGEYIAGGDLWKAFKLQGDPPVPIGIYENQPSPMSSNVTSIWSMAGVFLILLLSIAVGAYWMESDEQVFEQTFEFNTGTGGEASFVTDVFQLKGRTSDVEVTTNAGVDNDWIYLNCALIDQDTGHAYDFGREVSYYHGYDSDGSWSEGGTNNTVTIPSVPPGNYYLRIEPESDPNRGLIRYVVTVKRDVPQASFMGLAALALLIPAGLITWRSMNFEHLRWAESDYGAAPDGSLLNTVENIKGAFKSSGDDE